MSPSSAVPIALPAPVVVLDSGGPGGGDGGYERRTRTREDEVKEAIRLSLEEGGAAETGEAGQACLSEFCVMDDQTFSPARPPVDPTGAFSYRLVGVVTHYGGTTRSGHYVSDV